MKFKSQIPVFLTIFIFLSSCTQKILLKENSNISFIPVSNSIGSNFKSHLTSQNIIITTGQSDLGLNVYEFSTNEFFQLNVLAGAGTRFFPDKNEENIIFQTYSLTNNRKYNSILKMRLTKGSTPEVIEENKRNLKLLGVVENQIIYLEDDKIVSTDMITNQKSKNTENLKLAFSDNELNLVILKNGNQNILNPLGKGNYIWVSISPDKKQILFHKAEKGTFVCDLKGENIIELGNINNPKWVQGSDWVIGTEETDDGHKYLKSDIILFNAKDRTRINMTANTDHIALYPSISSKFDRLIFNDENGKLYISELKNPKFK